MYAAYKVKKIKYHIFFIFILSLNYFFPLAIFNEITLFYHDVLDAGLVYYYVIGKYLSGHKNSVEFFLNGNIQIEYLRHWLKPYSLLYSFFQTEFAYWLTEILIKLTSYCSFFILAKKISKNVLISSFSGALYACINYGYIEGFGTAIFPYLLYIALFKSKLKLKNYIIILFFGFNSDIVRDIFMPPILLCLVWIIDCSKLKEQFSIIIKLIILFFIGMFVSSSNLIYVQLFDGPFHREEFASTKLIYSDIILTFLKNLIRLDFSKTWLFFFQLPFIIFLLPLLIISVFQKSKIVYKLLILYLLIHVFIMILNFPSIIDLKNNSSGILRSFNFNWIRVYLPVVSLLLFIFTLIGKNFDKILLFASFITLIFFQINSSIIPIIKKNTQGVDYRNLYTFNGYYLPEDYKKIKNIVANDRVLSIGLDPMIAVKNNIKTIDGYHTLYPLKYKKEFRVIIEKELENNLKLKDYYDNWGSRVYAFTSDPKNIKINFKEAKKIGAKFIISKYEINHKDLAILCEDCSKHFKLYKIN